MNKDSIQAQTQHTCYLCNSPGSALYKELQDRVHGVPGRWSFRRCTNENCEFVWLDPMPKADEIWKLYQSYHTHGLNDHERSLASPSYLTEPLKRNILGVFFGYNEFKGNILMQWLARFLNLNPSRKERIGRTFMWARGEWRGRVLDIGCGNGKLLYILKLLGWDCTGYEPDPVSAKIAQEHYKINMYQNDLQEIHDKEKPFDLITSSHVIEHLLDPVQNLKQYNDLLRPGGKIIIATPNINSLASSWFKKSWYPLEPPRHLYLFNKKTLTQCLEKAGFENITVKTSAADFKPIWRRSTIIKKHNKMIPEAYTGRQSLKDSFVTRMFNVVEHLSVLFNRGEELIAIASKKK